MRERVETFRAIAGDGTLYILQHWIESAGLHTPAERRDIYQTREGLSVNLLGSGGFVVPSSGMTLRRELPGTKPAAA